MSPVENSEHYLVFMLAKVQFAVPLLSVQEVIGYEGVQSIGNMPEHVEGLLRLRGDPVISLDLAKILGTKLIEPRHRLIFQLKDQLVAVAVDQVMSVIQAEQNKLQKLTWKYRTDLQAHYFGNVPSTTIQVMDLHQYLETTTTMFSAA